MVHEYIEDVSGLPPSNQADDRRPISHHLSMMPGKLTRVKSRRHGRPFQPWCLPLVQTGHSGTHVRRFVGCILEEILLFPVARTGLRERIRVQAALDFLRNLVNNDAVHRC